MENYNDIVKLAVDTFRGKPEKYSVNESLDLLRKALVEVNNGSTKLDLRAIRDGKCNGLFTIIEQILDVTIPEGLTGDEYFNSLVDFRNVPLGDQNLFITEDSDLFMVSEVAPGTQGIRRQRLGGHTEAKIDTSYKAVKIYDELGRVLSGQVDFNKFITRVSESFRQHILNDIYSVWNKITDDQLGGETFFPAAGAYSESALLELVAHVEAAAGGKPATIIGTGKGLRTIAPSVQGADSKSDLYNLGYYGKFYGTNVVKLPQRHAIGTTDFIYDDDVLTIVAGDEKLIKFVYEGDTFMHMGDPLSKADVTQEYTYITKYGLGIILAGGRNTGIGKYDMSTT